jgi:hypothetical protein
MSQPKVTEHPLSPPSLADLATILTPALQSNFTHAAVEVVQCPDLSKAPFHLAGKGLSGNESIADIGGQPNLFPAPKLDARWSLPSIAQQMKLPSEGGLVIGPGAGPWFVVGQNCELAANFSWEGSFDNITNRSHHAEIKVTDGQQKPIVQDTPSTDCALMTNIYGSAGQPGPVLKVTARARIGPKTLTDCIRFALKDAYGDSRPISMGGAFLIKKGKAKFHIMPDFPPKEQLPFKTRKELNDWLTYHDFEAPIVCLSVFHSADPENLGLRMEHTHCFAADGGDRGGHYHYDLDGDGDGGEVEYEAYFNTAKVLYRVDKPDQALEGDIHD